MEASKKNQNIFKEQYDLQVESMYKVNNSMIQHATAIAEEINANAVLVYVDVIKSRDNLKKLFESSRCILAARSNTVIEELKKIEGDNNRIIRLPYINLSRYSQVKVAAIVSLSKGLIKLGDRLICLSGSPEYGIFDNISVLDLGREFEMFSSIGLGIANQMSQPEIFERLLTLVLELAEEGKEGKPIGTTFVLGDHEKVFEISNQLIINPFRAVPEKECNILDPDLKETIREFSSIDGAFIIRDDGVILAAGRHLSPSVETNEIPMGLGARHRSAAGVTALTNSISLVISESTGDVRIFNRGKLFMEINRAKRGNGNG